MRIDFVRLNFGRFYREFCFGLFRREISIKGGGRKKEVSIFRRYNYNDDFFFIEGILYIFFKIFRVVLLLIFYK